MRAGDLVRALDVPPPAADADATSELNLSNTAFEPVSPEVTTTFVAEVSGVVWIVVGGGLRDGGTNRIMLAPQVHLGSDSSGPVVMAPAVSRNAWTNASVNTANFAYGSRMKPLSGLTPGATYFARVMLAVSGGSTADKSNAQIFVVT